MKCTAVLFLAIVAVASAFRPTLPARFVVPSQTRLFEQNSLVPVEKANIENAAAVTGGIVGFALGGPVVALILAAVSNYAVKKDNDAGIALRGFGKVVMCVNLFADLKLSVVGDKWLVDVIGAVLTRLSSCTVVGSGQWAVTARCHVLVCIYYRYFVRDSVRGLESCQTRCECSQILATSLCLTVWLCGCLS